MHKLVILTAMLAGLAVQANAHAFLQTAVPRVGSTARDVSVLRLTFTEALEPAFSRVTLEDANGAPVAGAKTEVDPHNAKVLIGTGAQAAAARKIPGEVARGVGGHAPYPGRLRLHRRALNAPVRYALIATEWVHVAAAMLLLGGGAMGEVFRRFRCGWDAQWAARLFRLLRPAALVALLSAGAWLLLEAASMSGIWADAARPAVIRTVLTDTAFGHLWMARLAIAFAVCLIAWLGRGRSLALALFSAALLASLAMTGHAIMHAGWLGAAQRLSQGVHLLAAGLWLGGLLPLGLLLAGAGTRRMDRAPVIRALRRFSDVAVIAVLLVLGSGVFNTWMLLGKPSALVTSAYGRTLLAKLVLVAALIAVALANRFLLMPAIAARGEAAVARLERNVKMEILLGAAIVAAAVVLGNLAP